MRHSPCSRGNGLLLPAGNNSGAVGDQESSTAVGGACRWVVRIVPLFLRPPYVIAGGPESSMQDGDTEQHSEQHYDMLLPLPLSPLRHQQRNDSRHQRGASTLRSAPSWVFLEC